METIFLIVRHSFAQSQVITATSVLFILEKFKLVARAFDSFGLARRWQPISLLLNTALPWIRLCSLQLGRMIWSFQTGCMNIRPCGLARRWQPYSLLLLNTALPWARLLQPPSLIDGMYGLELGSSGRRGFWVFVIPRQGRDLC